MKTDTQTLVAEVKVTMVVGALLALSNEDRMKVFSNFCKHCGCDNPKCRCWDDE